MSDGYAHWDGVCNYQSLYNPKGIGLGNISFFDLSVTARGTLRAMIALRPTTPHYTDECSRFAAVYVVLVNDTR